MVVLVDSCVCVCVCTYVSICRYSFAFECVCESLVSFSVLYGFFPDGPSSYIMLAYDEWAY